jgi:diaminohydroxyphosphoribosylaminopyrimidine deaminase/5-amino-6-(5-phosphoribosylamino)uracil reductase
MNEYSREDRGFMRRALALAARGLNACAPNPRVGCVLVREGRIVGEGWHERAGEAHAEIRALRAAGAEGAGAAAYVTLEPCCHHGRTPPCTQALIAARVCRVVAAMHDPDPRVSGGGLAELARAGVEVASGLCEDEARALNAGFVSRVTRARPYLRSKLAASLDGATAMASGESQWITGDAARRDVQRLRARSSAILTGVATVLHDDPRLSVRLPAGAWIQPLRVVLDSELRMTPDARVLHEPGATLVFTASDQAKRADALRRAGAEVERSTRSERGLALEPVLAALARRGVNDVLVEAGATLNGALLEAGLIDELLLYLAPRVLGRNTRGMFELPRLETLGQGIALELLETRRVGTDLRLRARPASTAPDSGAPPERPAG